MTRTAVITQPTYLPWLGYFEQMRRADVFIFLDSVQFDRRSWQCRNRIQNVQGQLLWLTVPHKSHPRETAIREIEICDDPPGWVDRHLALMSSHLRRAPYAAETYALVEPILRRPTRLLADLNISLVRVLAGYLGLRPEFLRSSELPVSGGKADLIVNLLRHVGATDYYSSAGSAAYLEPARGLFEDAGIRYTYQTWPHPTYPQSGTPFTSHLSIVDALSWTGRGGVRAMLGLDSVDQDPLVRPAADLAGS